MFGGVPQTSGFARHSTGISQIMDPDEAGSPSSARVKLGKRRQEKAQRSFPSAVRVELFFSFVDLSAFFPFS
ncbi:MAG: hypothetical protein KAI38_09560 [Candidatus Latescibacteria bacterium]|nr:hypothetical protein [Candidatus Latescibacterota bacterium]